MPALSVSASRDNEGRVHVSVVNAHAHDAVQLACDLKGIVAAQVGGRILTADRLDAHNTFQEPQRVKPAQFDEGSLAGGKLQAAIPPRSVVVFQLSD
jgi:alpha-N-arabinofuranosidase